MACNCEFQKRLLSLHTKLFRDPAGIAYLDYNATTPVDPRVLGAFDRSCRRTWGNPSSLHAPGIEAFTELEESRNAVGRYFGVDPEGLHFCGSGSEAIHAGVAGFLEANPRGSVVTTAIEHAAVLGTVENLTSPDKRRIIPVDGNGQVDPAVLKEALSSLGKEAAALIILSPVNHETGSIQPIKELAARTGLGSGNGKAALPDSPHKSKDRITVFFDAIQAAARLEPRAWSPYCDMFAVSSHKLYAPKGVGLLWTRDTSNLRPSRYGGNQEGGIFPGTENTPGIAAFAEALRLMSAEFEDDQRRLKVLTAELMDGLSSVPFPVFIESPETSVPGVLCVSMPWIRDMEMVLEYLIGANMAVSRFSACTNGATGESAILKAMGRPPERAGTSIRISLGKWSRREDIFRLLKALTGFYRANTHA